MREFVPPDVGWTTRPYRLTYLGVERARELIDKVLLAPGHELQRPAAIHADVPGNRLFITADAATHAALQVLLEAEDQPLPETQRPLRIYRPQNRKAAELIGTLTQLLGDGSSMNVAQDLPNRESYKQGDDGIDSRTDLSVLGSRQVPPVPPAPKPQADELNNESTSMKAAGPGYVLIEDEHTNSILAVGTRDFHVQLASLIEDLDRRRPQVMIEMKLVAITLKRSMDLGVELQSLDLGDGWDFLLFSSFGLSSTDLATGQRVLEPGLGANGVLLRPDRVVNASDTVATTSFAGFESAGTTLSVTPHILEGDHLTLEYELSFSNFTGTSSQATVPPPRTTNSFNSMVEVPDGYTVVTGGLVVDNKSDSASEVPYLGKLPILGKLFQSTSKQNTHTRVFAFIKPVILREDEFEDLKFITLKDIEAAQLPPEEAGPPLRPLWME